jgi:hypothetical protein
MEEVVIEEKMEPVLKYHVECGFPAVSISAGWLYFNKYCLPLLGQAVEWFFTDEYVIGLPAKKGMVNAYAITVPANKNARVTSLNAAMRNKGIKNGVYKVYKYKDGFAFKRYEPLKER